MRRADQGRAGSRSRCRLRGAVILSVLTVVAALLAGCGSGGSSEATGARAAGAAPTAMQVLTRAERGDIVASVTGAATATVAQGKTTVVATVSKEHAASVATGQKASVVLFPAGANRGQAPPEGQLPQGAPNGAPVPNGAPSGMAPPASGQSGAPMPPDGANPGAVPGGRDGFGSGSFRTRGTAGTVVAVALRADGAAAVTIKLTATPSNATDGATGMAVIATRVLAADVVVIPTAAISGSGDAATVQVLAGGQTTARQVQVGQQAGGQSEIVSGLEAGENVVWTRSFSGGARPGGSFRSSGQFGGGNGGATQ